MATNPVPEPQRIPPAVCRAYSANASSIRHVPSLINDTYFVDAGPGGVPQRLVIQCVHPVFEASVHEDIRAVTEHLAAQGLDTPRLIPTNDGALYFREERADDARIWRAQSFVPGLTLHVASSPAQLESAARLLAGFHRALSTLAHRFVHQRPIHDTPRHLDYLRENLASPAAQGDAESQRVGASVLAHAEGIETTFSNDPLRVVHGDPKLSNVLFFEHEPTRARCLIDLDTVGRARLAFELGDALRSWCNPSGEDVLEVTLEEPLVSAALEGYLSAAPPDLTIEESVHAIDGLETVSCELASRFAADAIVDRYFGWDPTRFGSRREHNLRRARGQLALSKEVRRSRARLLSLVERCHARAAQR
jgi:Ser/Thr protein kinase RdoA (MazF antagonist)